VNPGFATFGLEWLAAGKRVFTFDNPANEGLLRAGAAPIVEAIDWSRMG